MLPPLHKLGGRMEAKFLGGPADGQTISIAADATSWQVPVPGYRALEYVLRKWSYNTDLQTGDVTYARFFVPAHLSSDHKDGLILDYLRKNSPLGL